MGGKVKIKWFRGLPTAADFAQKKLISCSFIYWKLLMPLLSGKKLGSERRGERSCVPAQTLQEVEGCLPGRALVFVS